MKDKYRTIETASSDSGLSRLQLHQMRVAKLVRTRIELNGRGKLVPLYNMDDIEKWMEEHAGMEKLEIMNTLRLWKNEHY